MALPIRSMQKAVDRVVQQNGGYWRPASAAFNLYEELLALDEATFAVLLPGGQLAPVDADEVQRRLVRAFVAAICIATQYSVHLSDAFRDLDLASDLEDESYWKEPREDLRALVLRVKRRVAQVARVVTLYDFEDVTVDSPDLPRVAEAVPRLLVEIVHGFAGPADFRTVFYQNVHGPRSARRYASPFDPGTAPVLDKIRPIQNETFCPFAKRARLWGAPTFDKRLTLEENLRESLTSLRIFIRVARREVLDGYVYGFPIDQHTHSIDEVRSITAQFVFFLLRACEDQSEEAVRSEIDGDPLKWRFKIFGEECFVNVFSPAYESTHSRFTYSSTDMMFIMLQPETSFHTHIPTAEFQTRRDAIRQKFDDEYQGYTLDDAEAHRFVLPLDHSDGPVRWYE